jgi:hypothetical protein
MAYKTRNHLVRVKKTGTNNKHLPTKTKGKTKLAKLAKVEVLISEEVGIITTPVFSAEPIESPDSKWIHRMEKDFPNGVKHLRKVLKAYGFYTFDDACRDYHENPEPFRMFFKSTGLALDTENTLEVLQLKLVQGFKKVEAELSEHGMGEEISYNL